MAEGHVRSRNQDWYQVPDTNDPPVPLRAGSHPSSYGGVWGGPSRSTSILVLLFLGVLLTFSKVGAQSGAADPRTLTFNPLEFAPREPDRLVFENGMVVYLLEDHELPLVKVQALMRTGSWLDPADQVGLAELTGTVMRTGGSDGVSASQVDEELEQVSAHVTLAIGRQSGSASLDVLTKNLKQGLQLFAGLIRAPAFEEGPFDLAKLLAVDQIRRRQDDVESMADREWVKLLYGPTHPTARESTLESVQRITRQDVIAFHRKTTHPNGLILGVSGDFRKPEMIASLQEVFGTWDPGPVPDLNIAEVPEQESDRPVIRLVNKETSETYLRMGHLSIKENNEDYASLIIANDILGGNSFRGRLFNEVRTKRGLAYDVGSELTAGMYGQGHWLLWADTKGPSTKEVVADVLSNITRMRMEPVTDAELAASKDAYLNSFVFLFSSAAAIVRHRMDLEYEGLPKQHFQQMREKVKQVSKEDILAVARKYFHVEHLKMIAVGSRTTLSPILSSFDPVKEIRFPSENPKGDSTDSPIVHETLFHRQ